MKCRICGEEIRGDGVYSDFDLQLHFVRKHPLLGLV